MQRTYFVRIAIVSLACATGLMAQDSPTAWRTFGSNSSSANDAAIADQGNGNAQNSAPRPQYNDPPPPPNGNYSSVPETLALRPGAFVTVHVDQWLSSDKNQAGDTFYATLAEPLIVDGVVVARRGATVMGRVSDARKAGRVEGTSRLGLQLTSLSLVDGQQVSIQSQVIDRNGSTSVGRDAAAIGTTTALGAIIGASTRDSGQNAAIGAGVGAAAGVIGVLLSRGRATEVYPESMLTFRLDSAVNISTAHASAAFHYADQQDYGSGNEPRVAQQRQPRPVGPMGPVYGSYPYYDPYYYDPYYFGGGFALRVGPRYYGGSFRGRRR